MTHENKSNPFENNSESIETKDDEAAAASAAAEDADDESYQKRLQKKPDKSITPGDKNFDSALATDGSGLAEKFGIDLDGDLDDPDPDPEDDPEDEE